MIDSATKRESMLNFSAGDLLPKPSGTVSADERMTFLDLYSGFFVTGGGLIVSTMNLSIGLTAGNVR